MISLPDGVWEPVRGWTIEQAYYRMDGREDSYPIGRSELCVSAEFVQCLGGRAETIGPTNKPACGV